MMNRQQGPNVSQGPGQYRQPIPGSRQMMSSMNPPLTRGVSGGRMTASPGASSWGYPQQGQSTPNPLSFSQIQESSRPSSTNPYNSSSLQAFDRSANAPWQSASLDPSDFPALGSASSSVSHGPPSSQSYASTAGTSSHQQRLQQQMGVFGRSSGSNDDFNMNAPFSQDEFPALGGMNDGHPQRLPQHLPGQSNGVYDPRQQGSAQLMTPPPPNLGSQSLQQQQDHRSSMLEALQQGQRLPARSGFSSGILSVKDNHVQSYPNDDQKMTLENSTGLSSEDINAAADAAQPMPNLNQSDYPPQDFDKGQDTDTDIWGIKGLLGIIKVEDSEKSKLALGVDLTTLGLNMNQPDVRPLYPQFHSPWQDLSRQPTVPDFDPKFDLPACYRMSAPPSAQSKMSKFAEETLFYIFYAMPQDVLQDAAAYELTRRNWRYHKGIQMWLTKPQDILNLPVDSYEESEFVFWDVSEWRRVPHKFFLSYDMLEQRDVSLPYEEAHPEAAKLERRGSMETSRKVSSGKPIGSGNAES